MDRKPISFGRFGLDVCRRELLRDGEPLQLHSRALDILCAMAKVKGEIVRKDELMARRRQCPAQPKEPRRHAS